MKLVDYLMTEGYIDSKEHTLKMKIDFKRDPILRNKSMPIKFEVTDGTATLPIQFIIEFGVPPPEKKEEV
jgi:hypothetical protein